MCKSSKKKWHLDNIIKEFTRINYETTKESTFRQIINDNKSVCVCKIIETNISKIYICTSVLFDYTINLYNSINKYKKSNYL